MTEVADIFRQHGPQYRDKFGDRILPSHLQAMRDIQRCRTEALGGHVYHCQKCDEIQYSYHSCRNRHCPKCQNGKAQEWLEKQQALLLPVPFFMFTFTLPAPLRKVARSNQSTFYNLLFRSSAAATQHLAGDPRFVGGQIGMLGALHTWGRNLAYHPHVHYLVPAGGMAPDGQYWLPGGENFLLPVKALSKIFRARFRDALLKTDFFDDIPKAVWKQDWVVHCKLVGDGRAAMKYLSAYIFRVAINNYRILKLEDSKVTFRYKDTETGKTRLCTLPAEEFIRRFLQHVLPCGFVKVRYYGLFSPSHRSKLAALHQQLGSAPPDTLPEDVENQDQTSSSLNNTVPCPTCGRAMQRLQSIQPQGRHPP
ncbi:MAG: IS91 family transposase [Anaerolineales bacterium]|nr:IS91 family transposase [Anaerolineales bacterium]